MMVTAAVDDGVPIITHGEIILLGQLASHPLGEFMALSNDRPLVILKPLPLISYR